MDKECKKLLKETSKLLQSKDYENAELVCRNILQLDPANYNALVYLGACLDRMDRKDESKQTYFQATELQPDQILAWQGLGKLFESCGEDYPEESMNVYLKLVNLYRKQNTLSKAEDNLNALLKLYLKFGHSQISSDCIHDLCQPCVSTDQLNIFALQLEVYFYAENFIRDFVLSSTNDHNLSQCISNLCKMEEEIAPEVELIGNTVLYLNKREFIQAESKLSEHEDISTNIHLLCLAAILLLKIFKISDCLHHSDMALSYFNKSNRNSSFFYQDKDVIQQSVRLVYWEATLLSQDPNLVKKFFQEEQCDAILTKLCLKNEERDFRFIKLLLQTKLGDQEAFRPFDEELNEWTQSATESQLTALEQNLFCRVHLESVLLHDSDPDPVINRYMELLDTKSAQCYFASYFHLGYLYLRLNKIDESVKMLLSAYERYPESPFICEHLGIALLKSDNQTQGVEILENIEIGFRSPEVWLCLGLNYLSLEQFNDALQAMQRVVISDKQNPLYWECLGDVVMKQGSYLRAIKAYSEAAALDLMAINPCVQCGKANLLLERFDEALDWFGKALEIDGNCLIALKGCAETHVSKTRLLLNQSLIKMAELELIEAFKYLAKAYSPVKNSQVVCLLHLIGDALTIPHVIWDSSFKMKLPSHITNLRPTDSDDYEFDQVLSVDEMLQLGARYYATCLKIDSKFSSDLWFCLGQNYTYQWKRNFHNVSKSQPNRGEIYKSEKIKNLLDPAESFIRKAIVLDDTDANYWNSLGVVLGYKHLLQGNSFYEAQHCFCKCLELCEHPEASSNLGFLYLKEEKFELAEEMLRNSQAANPDNIHCLLALNSLPRGLSKDEKFGGMLQAAMFEPDVNVLFQLTRYLLDILSRQSDETILDQEIIQFYFLVATDGLKKILDLYPEDYRLWHDFALLLLHKRCYRQSIAALKKCLSLSPPSQHCAIIKHSYMLTKIVGQLEDVPSLELEEPRSFSQFCLKAYVDSVNHNEESGRSLYQKAVELSSGNGCGDDTSPECNIKQLSAAIGCHAILNWSNTDLARQAFLASLDQTEEDSVGIPDCVLHCVAAYSVKMEDEEIGREMIQVEDSQRESLSPDWVNLFAALKTLLDGPSAGLHYLRDRCHRYPDDADTWFYLSLYTWRHHKQEKMVSVLYALKNSMALSPHLPMSLIHATFLRKVLQDDFQQTRSHGSHLLQRAALYYPHLFLPLVNAALVL